MWSLDELELQSAAAQVGLEYVADHGLDHLDPNWACEHVSSCRVFLAF